VKANRAVAYLRTPCPCRELETPCQARNSRCISGNRLVPFQLIDVAGLVPGAHEGRGLGNRFLDDLRQAKVLIHVVDASGGTDAEGNPLPPGSRDPLEDVRFLEEEIEAWFLGIFQRGWEKVSRKAQLEGRDFASNFTEMYAGIGIRRGEVLQAVKETGLDPGAPGKWGEEGILRFSRALRRLSKPILIAANKTDVEAAGGAVQRLREALPEGSVVPTSSMGEYVLRRLAENGAVSYLPGDPSYEVVDEGKIGKRERKALEILDEFVFGRFGTTGVQECLNHGVLGLLGKIVVYPVEDEGKLADGEGRVLPDAFLLDGGSTPRDLAHAIHTEIGEGFLGALDARTRRKIPSEKPLKTGDVIKILTRG
jgi:hypothetical protein